MTARVSVIIPCFNAGSLLEETLDSALSQTTPAHEVIVIDDGSTDESPEIARKFGERVRLVQQENAGESVARNRGFELASGEWLAFLDADDVWKPTKLERQLELIAERVICVHTAYYKFGEHYPVPQVLDASSVPAEVRYQATYLAHNMFLAPSCTLVRRSVKARFPTWTRYGEDLIFFLDLLQEGEFRMVEEALTGHRVHARAQSSVADRELDWRKSVMQWLVRREAQLKKSQIQHIQRAWDARVLRKACAKALRGDFEQLWAVKRELGPSGVMRASPRAALQMLGIR